ELHAHRARADNDQALGNRRKVQDFDVSKNELRIGLKARQHARLATGGDDDVLGLERLHSSLGLDFHLTAALERGIAGDALHLGALQQHLDALGMFVDDSVLALLHLRVVQPRIFDIDAVGFGVDEMFPNVGGMEQAFGRDASHQKASSAELGLLFDERCFQTVLAGADSCGVAAGTTPDNDEIVGHFYYSSGRIGENTEVTLREGSMLSDGSRRSRARAIRRRWARRNRRRFAIAPEGYLNC